MKANEYQQEMKKFVSNIKVEPEQSELIMSALGVAGEAGEYADLIKKVVLHGKSLDREHAIKELGDVCWYVALACNCLYVPLEEVFDINIDKLSKRYSTGKFTVEEANNKKIGDV